MFYMINTHFAHTLYNIIESVRYICEKFRFRGQANFPSRQQYQFRGEANFSSCLSQKLAYPLNRYFSQITLNNRTYLFNSAEYLTARKTVACK
jgi:hypothetical protein